MLTRRRSLAAASVACLLAGLASGEATAPAAGEATAPPPGDAMLTGLPDDLSESLLRKGWLVLQEVDAKKAGLSGGYVLAYAIFEKPLDETFALLRQTDRHTEYRKELRYVKRIEVLPNGVIDEHYIKVMLVKILYRLRYRIDDEARRIQWELDPSFDNSLDRAEGFWELYAMSDGRTLARFGSVVDIGAAMPGPLQDFITRKKVPKSIDDCRRWVDSDGEYRP